MVGGRALFVAVAAGDLEDPLLARRQQLLHRELGRGVEIERRDGAVAEGLAYRGFEGGEMGFEPGRDLERRGLDLDEPPLVEEAPYRGDDPRPREQIGTPFGVAVGAPPGRLNHGVSRMPAWRDNARCGGAG